MADYPESWLKWHDRGSLASALRIKKSEEFIGEILEEFSGYKKGDFQNAEKFSESTLSLPFTTEMSVKDVTQVVDAVRKVVSYFTK